jgi:hypothetical protein
VVVAVAVGVAVRVLVGETVCACARSVIPHATTRVARVTCKFNLLEMNIGGFLSDGGSYSITSDAIFQRTGVAGRR